MSSAAQILANQANAQHSAGPVTVDGQSAKPGTRPGVLRDQIEARSSQNATKLGLFSANGFVRPDEQEIFDAFRSGYMAELSPETPLEETLAREIIHAAWRLRRCALTESRTPEEANDGAHRPPLGRPLCAVNEEALDRIQASVDRARTTAQRTLHRALAELRRVRREYIHASITLPIKQAAAENALLLKALNDRHQEIARAVPQDSAKQSQSQTASIARNAPCPCGSREKYKRCCGTSAQAPTRGAVVRV